MNARSVRRESKTTRSANANDARLADAGRLGIVWTERTRRRRASARDIRLEYEVGANTKCQRSPRAPDASLATRRIADVPCTPIDAVAGANRGSTRPRGSSKPLARVASTTGSCLLSPRARSRTSVLVPSVHGGPMGLVTNRISDIEPRRWYTFVRGRTRAAR